MSSSEGSTGEEANDRWRRRLTNGDALSTSEALRKAEAARVAERAQRASGREHDAATPIRPSARAGEQLTVHEFTVGSSTAVPGSAPRTIDLTDTSADSAATSARPADAPAPVVDLTDAATDRDGLDAIDRAEDSIPATSTSTSTTSSIATSTTSAGTPDSDADASAWPVFGSSTPAAGDPPPPPPPTEQKTSVLSLLLGQATPGDASSADSSDNDATPVQTAPTQTAPTESTASQSTPTESTPPESTPNGSISDTADGDRRAATLTPPSRTRPALTETEVVSVRPAATESVDRYSTGRSGGRSGSILLVIASVLAVLTGILATMLLLERSSTGDLEAEVERAQAAEAAAVTGLEEVAGDIRTLELENERLQQQLNDMSALVLELPEGRVTEISVPFVPTFADEENGRLIAMSADGEYITWGEGADGPITDTGTVSGSPTGLFAATRKAWVSTDGGQVDVLSMVAGEPGLDSVEVGPISFLAAEERGYWTYNAATSEVVRLKKSDGSMTDSVAVPVPVVDLTIGAGSVWALGDDDRVYRINTADLTVSPLDVGTDLISITAGPDALWTLSAADGSLRRIDPVTGEILVTVPVGRDPIDATFAGNSVWVALRSGSSLIEVDTLTAAVVSRTPLPSEPAALHQGDSGVFVTTTGDVSLLRVASISPAPVTTEEDPEAADESS